MEWFQSVGSRWLYDNFTFYKRITTAIWSLKNQTNTGVIQARVSVLYDVLNHYVLDGVLSTKQIGERVLALKHLVKSKAKDLIIYDRGYPSYDFIDNHQRNGIDYLMRVKVSFSGVTKAFIASGRTCQIVEIYPGKDVDTSTKL